MTYSRPSTERTGVGVGSDFGGDAWAVILGASSGIGLATAHKLAEHGMSLCLVHRDRRGAMPQIEAEFEKLRGRSASLLTFNVDALAEARREQVLDALAERLGAEGRVRVLLHSIAFGHLKLLAPEPEGAFLLRDETSAKLARALGVDADRLRAAVDGLFAEGHDRLHPLASPPVYPSRSYLDDDDLRYTIHAMGTSLLDWTQSLLRRGLFADDARVLGLTSEGNRLAWKGYAAVAAAKVALESIARSMAVELAPHGIRSNVVQAGITETAALKAIPGSDHLKAQARSRNPFGRLTTPRDVANAIYLLCTDDAAWINGEVIRVDGGEHVSGAIR
jgi:NAD(P)-dependent dehydrogenase (short-subunit alcohol dehydrogenase family)